MCKIIRLGWSVEQHERQRGSPGESSGEKNEYATAGVKDVSEEKKVKARTGDDRMKAYRH